MKMQHARLALTVGLVVVAGCADDGGDDGDDAGAGAADPAVEVTAVDYGFDGLPDELDAGTTLTLRNQSDAELHELVALRLGADEDRPVDELVALPQAELEALFAGEPALVLVAPPGDQGFVALGDGALGDPGRYAVFCFIPTGADPQAYLDALEATPGQPPQVDGGPPHFTAGMYAEVVVR